ncbi:MAG TPA: hypothetical protein VKZ88_00965 [Fibrobacteria bacterium]|nr:hypothetical protein [Fibrobacteria bacterium]
MTVTPEARFITLGPEIGSRIQSRELVLLSYMALAGTLLSASLTGNNRSEFALAIPYLALASALIGMHHDLIIGVLSDFLRDLSRDTPDPRWHYGPRYLQRALKYRTIRDLGVAFFMVFSVAASLFASWPGWPGLTSWTLLALLWWGGLLSGLGVVLVIVFSWGVRNEKAFARWLWDFERPARAR